jgi:hypothetical protein
LGGPLSGRVVPPRGFEPLISALKGRSPLERNASSLEGKSSVDVRRCPPRAALTVVSPVLADTPSGGPSVVILRRPSSRQVAECHIRPPDVGEPFLRGMTDLRLTRPSTGGALVATSSMSPKIWISCRNARSLKLLPDVAPPDRGGALGQWTISVTFLHV